MALRHSVRKDQPDREGCRLRRILGTRFDTGYGICMTSDLPYRNQEKMEPVTSTGSEAYPP